MPPCNYCKNRHEDSAPSETQCPSCLTYHNSIVNNVKIVQISVKKEATVDDLLELIQKKFKGTISDELNAKPMAVPPMKIYLKDSNVKPTRTSTARAVPKRFEAPAKKASPRRRQLLPHHLPTPVRQIPLPQGTNGPLGQL